MSTVFDCTDLRMRRHSGSGVGAPFIETLGILRSNNVYHPGHLSYIGVFAFADTASPNDVAANKEN